MRVLQDYFETASSMYEYDPRSELILPKSGDEVECIFSQPACGSRVALRMKGNYYFWYPRSITSWPYLCRIEEPCSLEGILKVIGGAGSGTLRVVSSLGYGRVMSWDRRN